MQLQVFEITIKTNGHFEMICTIFWEFYSCYIYGTNDFSDDNNTGWQY